MTKADYEAFERNPIWKEISSTLEEVIVGIVDDLSNMDPVTQAGALAKKQGRKLMAEFVLSLPKDILVEIEEKNKEGEKR